MIYLKKNDLNWHPTLSFINYIASQHPEYY